MWHEQGDIKRHWLLWEPLGRNLLHANRPQIEDVCILHTKTNKNVYEVFSGRKHKGVRRICNGEKVAFWEERIEEFWGRWRSKGRWKAGCEAVEQALELRVAKSLVLRVSTTVYFGIFTTFLAKFLNIPNLQQRQPKPRRDRWLQWLIEYISCSRSCTKHGRDWNNIQKSVLSSWSWSVRKKDRTHVAIMQGRQRKRYRRRCKPIAVRVVGEKLPLLVMTSQISMEEGIIGSWAWQMDWMGMFTHPGQPPGAGELLFIFR